MGVAPRREMFAARQMLLAHVQPTYIADIAVDNGNFTVVAIANRVQFEGRKIVIIDVNLHAIFTQFARIFAAHVHAMRVD